MMLKKSTSGVPIIREAFLVKRISRTANKRSSPIFSPGSLSNLIPASFHADAEGTLVGLDIRLLLLSSLLLRLLLLSLAAAPLHRTGTAADRRADRRTLSCITGNRAPDRAKRGALCRAVDHFASS